MFPLSDRESPRSGHPFITWAIILACMAVFLYELTLSGPERDAFFFRYGVIPAELAHGQVITTVTTSAGTLDVATPVPDWLTLFTSIFIHAGWVHLLGNMLFLWVFGGTIECKFGRLRYLGLYTAAGLAASWLQIAANTSSPLPSVGASGAIAGVLGAYILLYPYRRIRTAMFFFIITVVRVPAVYLLGFWFILQFFGGVASLGTEAQGGVAYWAHVGGFAFGLVTAAVYRKASRQSLWPRPEASQYWGDDSSQC